MVTRRSPVACPMALFSAYAPAPPHPFLCHRCPQLRASFVSTGTSPNLFPMSHKPRQHTPACVCPQPHPASFSPRACPIVALFVDACCCRIPFAWFSVRPGFFAPAVPGREERVSSNDARAVALAPSPRITNCTVIRDFATVERHRARSLQTGETEAYLHRETIRERGNFSCAIAYLRT